MGDARVIAITPLACQRDVERGLGQAFRHGLSLALPPGSRAELLRLRAALDLPPARPLFYLTAKKVRPRELMKRFCRPSSCRMGRHSSFSKLYGCFGGIADANIKKSKNFFHPSPALLFREQEIKQINAIQCLSAQPLYSGTELTVKLAHATVTSVQQTESGDVLRN